MFRRWEDALFVVRTLVSVVLVAFFSGWLVVASFDAARLSLNHTTTTAEVLGVSTGKWSDTVAVSFTTSSGDTVRTTVEQVWLLRPPKLGRSVQVQYDPEKPTRLRIVGQHAYAATAVMCVFALAVVGGTEWADWDRPPRRVRVEGLGGAPDRRRRRRRRRRRGWRRR
jgi:hypothetical protein